MREEPVSVLTIVHVGRVLALVATVGFVLRGVAVPDDVAGGDPAEHANFWHVVVWMCFGLLSLGLLCVLTLLGRLAEGMHLK